MFFSNEILTKKGGQFAVVWLVGNFNTVHGSKRLGLKKSDYVSVDVVKACDDMLNPRTQFALRLSSTLLMGIIRIYQKQITIVYDEVKTMWIFLKKGSFMRPENVELQFSRMETFALPNPLCHYDKEMGNEQSDIRFYTSLGEKALFEGAGGHKETHESRADSAYFTISFGDQEVTNTEYDVTLAAIAEESPAKRRKISKDSFLDIIEDERTPLKIREKSKVLPIEVPGELEFESAENKLLNISEEQLNEKFAECSQLQVSDSGFLVSDYQVSNLDDPTLENLSVFGQELGVSDLEDPLRGLPVVAEEGLDSMQLLDTTDQQFMPDHQIEGLVNTELQENIGEELLQEELKDNEDHDKENEDPNKENEEVSNKFGDDQEETEKENLNPNSSAMQGNILGAMQANIEDMLLKEISTRINNDPVLQEMQAENDPSMLENEPTIPDKENTAVYEDDDKENRDPNAPRRSQRAKKPLRLAQEKAFDTSLGSFTLPEVIKTPKGTTKRKRKRQLIVDTKTQLSVKEMKKYMKSSRQHLCQDPSLVHKIRPSPEELFAEPHRAYMKRTPELLDLWKRCAHSGEHDLTEMLELQEQMDAQQKASEGEETRQEGESSRKRPRSSVLSDIEVGRFGGNSTIMDTSAMEVGRMSRGSDRLDSTVDDTSITTDNFGAGGFRTSTVLKPDRGSGLLGPMLSPIQQMADLEQIEFSLQPLELLLPTIEENSMVEDPTIAELPSISDLQTTIMEPESTMFGQETRGTEQLDERPMSPVLEDLRLEDERASLGENQLLLDTRPGSPPLSERPRTPLLERLSGLPQEPEETVQEEDMNTFKYFPHRESRKFFKFVERKFVDDKNTINFEDLVPLTHTKKTAALAFYQLLLLKKFNHVEVSQGEEYFSEISIKLAP